MRGYAAIQKAMMGQCGVTHERRIYEKGLAAMLGHELETTSTTSMMVDTSKGKYPHIITLAPIGPFSEPKAWLYKHLPLI